MLLRTGAIALAALVVVASCSSNKKATTTPTTPTPSTSTRAPVLPGVTPNAAVLTIADLPSGWTSKPHKPATDNTVQRSIASCMHVSVDVVDTNQHPHADADDFTGPGGVQVQSGVAQFNSPAAARAAVDIYRKPAAAACQQRAYTANLKKSKITVATATPPSVAQDVSAVTVTDHVAGITAYAVQVQAQQGIYVAYVIYTALSADVAQAAALVAKMTARLSPA